MRYIRVLLVLYIVSVSVNAFADFSESFVKGESLSLPCLGCHGKSKVLSIPSLFGLEEDYIYNSLIEYQTGQREHYLMRIISNGYDDVQLRIISKYYSLQGIKNE